MSTPRNLAAVQEWLDGVVVVTDLSQLDAGQSESLMRLVGDPGMLLLLGIMVGLRQGFYVQLGNTSLATPEEANRAAVIQGIIKGIDLLPQQLLEVITPVEAPSQEQQA